MTPEDTSPGAPTSFTSNPRYWEHAGSIAGAKEATFTIGDGSNSWGDYNGTDEQPFLDAVAALPASGGTIVVKGGTYTFDSQVTINKPCKIVGHGRDQVTIVKNISSATEGCFLIGMAARDDVSEVSGIRFELGPIATSSRALVLWSGTFELNNLYFDDTSIYSSSSAVEQILIIRNCYIINEAGFGTDDGIEIDASSLRNSSIDNCILGATNRALNFNSGSVSDFKVSNCWILGEIGVYIPGATVNSFTMDTCRVVSTHKAIDTDGASLTRFSLVDSYVAATSTPSGEPAISIGDSTKTSISNNYIASNFAAAASPGSPSKMVQVSGQTHDLSVTNNLFFNTTPANYVAGIYLDTCDYSGYQVTISGNTFSGCSQALYTVNDVAGGKLVMDSCTVDGRSEDGALAGALVTPAGKIQIAFTNCTFSNLNSTSNAAYGIRVIHDTDDVSVKVANCTIDSVDSSGSFCSGIEVTDSTGTEKSEVFITNTTINDISSTAGAVYGINIRGNTQSVQKITNVYMEQLSVSGSFTVAGVNIQNSDQSSFSNISVENLSGSGTRYGIRVSDSIFDATFSNNTIVAGIHLTASNMNSISIIGNQIDISPDDQFGINMPLPDNSRSISIKDNVIECSTNTTSAIHIPAVTAGDNLSMISVTGNIIRNLYGNGIYSVGGDIEGISVISNSIHQTTFDATAYGIRLEGNSAGSLRGGAVCMNTILGLDNSTDAARSFAISVNNATGMDISNNNVEWQTGVSFGISVTNVSRSSVCNNVVRGMGTAADIDVLGASSTLVAGNRSGTIQLNGTTYALGDEGTGPSDNLFGYNLVS